MKEVIAHVGRCSEGEWGLKNGDGSPSGGILLLLQNPEEMHKVCAFPLPLEAKLRLGACAPAFADTIWGGLRRALNTNQMKAVAAGAWEQGAAPGACGWVTLYNYNTVVKAPEPEWRWAGGGCRLPICSASFRL